jgi:threonine dehydratase
MITTIEIERANNRIKETGSARTTALEYSTYLSSLTGAEVYLKCEHTQPTGSFKVRGATNKMTLLTANEKQRGVVTASSGNHGMATALGASMLGIDVSIYVPHDASETKVSGIKALGASVIKVPGDCLLAEKTARQVASEEGKVFISPYNDLDVITGQATTGLELYEQCPDLSAVFASVGGGGLIGGIGCYLKEKMPKAQIIAAWPEVAQTLNQCLTKGEIYEPVEGETISDGTAGGVEMDAVSFPICQKVIDECITVSEEQIKEAMRLIADKERWIIEGAAGVAVAAFLKVADRYQGQKVAIVLCGRNIALDKFNKAIA